MLKGESRSIKGKLIGSMAGMAVAITLLCGAALGILLYATSVNSMKERVQDSVTAYKDSVTNAIGKYKLEVEAIAKNPRITDESLSAEEKMEYLSRISNGLLGLNLTDGNGVTLDRKDVSAEVYFEQAMRGTTYITSTMRQEGSPILEVKVCTLVDNGTGYKGTVIAEYAATKFNQMIKSIAIGESGYGFIVDNTGVVIAHKDSKKVDDFLNYITIAEQDSSYFEMAEVVRSMTAGETDVREVTLDGQRLCIGYMPISDTDGWSIAVCADKNEMMSGFRTGIVITAIMVAVFIVLSVFMAMLIAKPIAGPITVLVRRIELLAQGDLHTEVPKFKRKDEIGQLSNAFTNTVDTLNGYVGEISEVLGSLALGDLTVEPVRDYRGDFSPIKAALGTIIKDLNRIFSSLVQSSEEVASGAEHVSATAQSMAQGAAEQAAAIEELTATTSKIARDVDRNAENAARTNELSQKALSGVEEGNLQMQQMLGSMAEISSTSAQIGEIIKDIEEIAFHTNILALNASVEAAHAGQHGKGFAVVAQEVKNLATKSAGAARHTTDLIRSSLDSVERGTKMANNTAAALGGIMHTAEQSAGLVAEISTASEKQTDAVHQLHEGIDQISSVVQANSAASEESAATSEELNSQAQMMKQMLSFLKLKEE